MIDLITNSSTSVYIYPSQEAIEKSKELIQNVFDIVGFEGKIDDYFEFDYEIEPDLVEYFLEEEDEEFYIVFNKYLENNKIEENDFFNIDYKERIRHYEIFVKDFKEEILSLKKINECASGELGEYGITNRIHLNLIIKNKKNGENFPLCSYFTRIFECEPGPG
jgi:hypothetical protein